MRFGLFPFRSPLLRESRLLSLPAGTEMFHFPALPPAALCIQAGATAHNGRRVSPFGNPRITAWLPAPRGLSQAPTSFFGSWYQGIHRVLLKTWHNKKHYNTQRNPPPSEKGHPRRDIGSSRYIDARVHCAVLKKRTAPQAPLRIRGRRPIACTEDPGQARFLRTQQRAHPEPVPPPPFRPARGRTGREEGSRPR